MHINERDVKMLLMVADGVSGVDMANKLGMTQPGVSTRLTNLNSELGGDFLVKPYHRAAYRINLDRQEELKALLLLARGFRKLRSSANGIGIQKATPGDVAEAIELRAQGLSWEKVAMILGKVHAMTWRDYVERAELLGFAAWPHA